MHSVTFLLFLPFVRFLRLHSTIIRLVLFEQFTFNLNEINYCHFILFSVDVQREVDHRSYVRYLY